MTENDQPRPDLDAAIDAVLPSLSALSADEDAASLRRTRIALADAPPEGRGVRAWPWAVPVMALVAATIVGGLVWSPSAPVDAPRGAVVHARPPAARGPLPAAAPQPTAPNVIPPRAIRPERLARAQRVEAMSAQQVDQARRPDPLIALARAVQEIPDDAWHDAMRGSGAIGVDVLSIAPIVVPPLVTPPIADLPAPPVQGEP